MKTQAIQEQANPQARIARENAPHIEALVEWAMSGLVFDTDRLHRMALNVMILESELNA